MFWFFQSTTKLSLYKINYQIVSKIKISFVEIQNIIVVQMVLFSVI
jgi:hypothetical protein